MDDVNNLVNLFNQFLSNDNDTRNGATAELNNLCRDSRFPRLLAECFSQKKDNVTIQRFCCICMKNFINANMKYVVESVNDIENILSVFLKNGNQYSFPMVSSIIINVYNIYLSIDENAKWDFFYKLMSSKFRLFLISPEFKNERVGNILFRYVPSTVKGLLEKENLGLGYFLFSMDCLNGWSSSKEYYQVFSCLYELAESIYVKLYNNFDLNALRKFWSSMNRCSNINYRSIFAEISLETLKQAQDIELEKYLFDFCIKTLNYDLKIKYKDDFLNLFKVLDDEYQDSSRNCFLVDDAFIDSSMNVIDEFFDLGKYLSALQIIFNIVSSQKLQKEYKRFAEIAIILVKSTECNEIMLSCFRILYQLETIDSFFDKINVFIEFHDLALEKPNKARIIFEFLYDISVCGIFDKENKIFNHLLENFNGVLNNFPKLIDIYISLLNNSISIEKDYESNVNSFKQLIEYFEQNNSTEIQICCFITKLFIIYPSLFEENYVYQCIEFLLNNFYNDNDKKIIYDALTYFLKTLKSKGCIFFKTYLKKHSDLINSEDFKSFFNLKLESLIFKYDNEEPYYDNLIKLLGNSFNNSKNNMDGFVYDMFLIDYSGKMLEKLPPKFLNRLIEKCFESLKIIDFVSFSRHFQKMGKIICESCKNTNDDDRKELLKSLLSLFGNFIIEKVENDSLMEARWKEIFNFAHVLESFNIDEIHSFVDIVLKRYINIPGIYDEVLALTGRMINFDNVRNNEEFLHYLLLTIEGLKNFVIKDDNFIYPAMFYNLIIYETKSPGCLMEYEDLISDCYKKLNNISNCQNNDIIDYCYSYLNLFYLVLLNTNFSSEKRNLDEIFEKCLEKIPAKNTMNDYLINASKYVNSRLNINDQKVFSIYTSFIIKILNKGIFCCEIYKIKPETFQDAFQLFLKLIDENIVSEQNAFFKQALEFYKNQFNL